MKVKKPSKDDDELTPAEKQISPIGEIIPPRKDIKVKKPKKERG